MSKLIEKFWLFVLVPVLMPLFYMININGKILLVAIIWNLLLPHSVKGQSFTFADLPWLSSPATAGSRFIPNSILNSNVYWFELTPTNSSRAAVNGTGAPPADGNTAGSWINLAHNNDVANSDLDIPVYHASGGGANTTSPRLSFNTTGTAHRYIAPSIGVFTNFTMIIVMKLTSTSGDQGLITNGNGVPKLTISSGIIAINSGSAVTGPVSIGTGATIITWVNFGASSRIDTNGVLYVSGNAGTTGFASGQGIYIAHPIVNQFNGEINRIWCWTNTLSAGNLQAAITQCGTDFGIHTPYTP